MDRSWVITAMQLVIGLIFQSQFSEQVSFDRRNRELTVIRVTDIPNSVTEIELGKNKLTSFVLTKPLCELTRFEISHNRLSSLPDLRQGAAKLSELLVDYNEITSVEAELLEPLQELRLLNINNNLLKTFPELSTPMPKLDILSLNGNLFDHVPTLALIRGQLTELRLSNNSLLTEVSRKDLQGFDSLSKLMLEDNKLKFIASLCHLPSIYIVYIENTQLDCGHHMLSMMTLVNNHASMFMRLAGATCMSPSELSGTSLDSLLNGGGSGCEHCTGGYNI